MRFTSGRDEAVPQSALDDHPGPQKLFQIVRTAGLDPCARKPYPAEGLDAHPGPGNAAIEIEIADAEALSSERKMRGKSGENTAR